MYLSIILINLVTIGLSYAKRKPEHISEVVDVRAVTEFAELEDLYRRLHKKNLKTPPKTPWSKSLRIQIKKKLCKKIFSSTYYDMREEDWFDLDDRNNALRIKEWLPHTFGHVFEDPSLCFFLCGTGKEQYVNDYRTLSVKLSDNSTVKEDLFSCFTKDRNSSDLKHYLVSKEYNVTAGMVAPAPMAARFVFGFRTPREMSLFVMAEESAKGKKFQDITSTAELRYVKFRENSKPSDKENEDPVCKLSHSHKLRLCASVFAAKIFRNKIKFKPLLDNVEENCVDKYVSFLADFSTRRNLLMKIAQRNIERDRSYYKEWVFTCKVSNVGTNNDDEGFYYYISRGDRPHSVFLYSEKYSNDQLYVENHFKNVTVVDASPGDNSTSVVESRSEAETEHDDSEKDKNETVEVGEVQLSTSDPQGSTDILPRGEKMPVKYDDSEEDKDEIVEVEKNRPSTSDPRKSTDLLLKKGALSSSKSGHT